MAAGHSEADEARRKRLAAALRENLKRRKAQSRAARPGGAAGPAARTGDAAAEPESGEPPEKTKT
jgi:hypothetical protein